MSPDEDVTQWLRRLKEGDRAAVQKMWQLYFVRLMEQARKRLGGVPRRAVDEEDVALSAFRSFCRNAEEGRFPQVDDRASLWQLLIRITVCKAIDQANHERRQKRDYRRVVPASELGEDGAFAEMISREPDPALAAQVAEDCQRLLDSLPDQQTRDVVVAKMEGETNESIAEKISMSLTSVERKLRGARTTLEKYRAM